ncbi:MAG TPA: cytidylate kinase-like family protein [Verrucomicrobiae bacterium]|nr:cytidylate kinase-like family protein [Verrucomicrobiae bacterium]
MNSTIDVEKCLSFINCQLKPDARAGSHNLGRKFAAVTISRQAGSGGHELAEKLAVLLQSEEPQPARPWTVFDRNLVEKVLADHHLPARLARFMPEDHVSEMTDIMDELFGLHPPSWMLVRKTSETILRLAHLGHVIIIGRAANVITARLPHVFHVRLVGSLHRRAERLEHLNQLTPGGALKSAQREDLARRGYLKQFFSKNIDDPLLYHFVINTDLTPIHDVARMIASEMAPGRMVLAA